MRLAVVGGRDFDNAALMWFVLERYAASVIISGGARGADSLAEEYAKINELNFICYPPLVTKYDTFAEAALARNKDIVNAADAVVAFPTKKSRGTWHTVNYAKKKGIPVVDSR